MLEGKDAIQRDLDRLKGWACVNVMMFKKARCNVLHIGQGSPKHKPRLCRECIESSPSKQLLGVVVDEKLHMTQKCALTPRRPTVSWPAPPAVRPAGQGRSFRPSALLW